MKGITSISHARDLDLEDPLARFRKEFYSAGEDLIYLNGNSLGRMPVRSRDRINMLMAKEWGERLIRGWGEGWLDLPQRLGRKIARLIGAQEDEVIVCDATSVNLYKLVMAALRFKQERYRIISDEMNFPSDLYILQGIADQLGDPYRLTILPSSDSMTLDPELIGQELDENTALLSFTHTYFKSAFVQDMAGVTDMAHQAGALVLWDLSHSTGSVPLDLNACRADLAVGCTYKYLNGGPGSPAFLYVRRDLQDQLLPSIQGWLGSRDPFNFDTSYEPGGGIDRFQVGTPPILSMAAIEGGLDIQLEAGMPALRAKSVNQTEYLIGLFDEWLAPLDFRLGSPRDPGQRGSHVSILHARASEITDSLLRGGDGHAPVICDFRQPDNIRLGVSPIYNSYEDIYRGMLRIRGLTEKLAESL